MKIEYTHGGDVYTENGGEKQVIDFSANINPLGIPTKVKQAIIDSIDLCQNYPDALNRQLRNKLSVYEDVDVDFITCGNGAGDIIFKVVLALKPKKALILAPTFSEYETALKTVDCAIDYYNLIPDNDFKITDTILDSITSELDIVFICNPNNPTGQLTKSDLMEKIIKKAKDENVFVVVDECFMEFVDNPEEYSVKHKINYCDNLLILKAFTKIFAIPGLRLGYSMTSNMALIKKMYEISQPWSVSVLSQKAGVVCLDETEYLQKTSELIKTQRKYLKDNLEKLGFVVYGSKANYVFFESSEKNLCAKLTKHDILVRSCSNYIGLSDNYYRVAVKSASDNQKLIKSLLSI